MSTTKPPARRQQPYLTLKVGGLTVVLKQRPRKGRALFATVCMVVGPTAALALQARYGA
ncbi:hypothetical protein [Kitasatospora sp. NPDC088779]|uniref:hypothetical protein n=1 Tax=Kitasatospora sp. NPDC088779 TaxID=3154964 RepID=UPI003435EF4B